jgi:hydroxypyruvate isomerase
MKFSVCIDMMFSRHDFMDRFAAVRAAGQRAVEFWKWTNKDIDAVSRELLEHGMDFAVFNIDSRDQKLSYDLSRGILNAGRKEELLAALKESAPIYKKLGACAMIVLVGETIEGVSCEEQTQNVYECLSYVKDYVEKEGMTLVVEPLNATDRQNYFMPKASDLMAILRRVNSPRIKMLYDIYHQHMTGDFDMAFIEQNLPFIGHFHVADCPGRHEPGTGEVDYVSILSKIARMGYDGYFGLEYRATVPDEQTFAFLERVSHV